MATLKKLYFHPRLGIAVVKQGFCWPAFLFGSLWALARRAHLLFALMLAVDVLLWFLTGYAQAQHAMGPALLAMLGTVVYAVLRGRRGNAWVQAHLQSRGYVPWAALS